MIVVLEKNEKNIVEVGTITLKRKLFKYCCRKNNLKKIGEWIRENKVL
ncbi:hypothetical protein [Clostridium tertium]|mgnify:CR=1|nr:hypothetical protein [Clostridium tertium]